MATNVKQDQSKLTPRPGDDLVEPVPKNKLSATVKVIRLADAADEKQKDVVLATLQRNEYGLTPFAGMIYYNC